MNIFQSVGLYLLTIFFGYQSPALTDLDYMYTTIMENHPGIYNSEDPLFVKHFQAAYDKAKSDLFSAIKTVDDQVILSAFAQSFDDPHLFLEWTTAQQSSMKTKAKVVRKRDFRLHHIDDNCVWITLPTFDLNEEQKKIFNEIVTSLPSYKNIKGIVFDIRGNRGGNSEYAATVVSALFGNDYAEQQRKALMATMSIDWRASVDNKEYLAKLAEKWKSSWLQHIIDGMELSLKNRIPFYRESFFYNDTREKRLKHDVTATIFVIIESHNASAALDFLDELLTMEPKKYLLVGEKTGADRLYMEVRKVPLPSGTGTFSFPIKVYRNRLRADKEPYFPDILCSVNDSPALQESVLKKLTEG